MSKVRTVDGKRLTDYGTRLGKFSTFFKKGHVFLLPNLSPSVRGLGGGFLRIIFLSLVLFITTLSSQAHESRPLFVEITETSPGVYELQYKIPASVPDFNLPVVSLPESFEELDKVSHSPAGLLVRNYPLHFIRTQ